MFTYSILSPNTTSTHLCGLKRCFDEIAHTNPNWGYQFLFEEKTELNPHLIILDLTLYQDLTLLSSDEVGYLNQDKGYKVLVLLKKTQMHLADVLLRENRCSLLCVDERLFRLREVVESSLKKRRYISASILSKQLTSKPQEQKVDFTGAELRVLKGLCMGKNGVEISQEIFRSQKTISTHKRNIMKKLGVDNDFELIMQVAKLDSSNTNFNINEK